MPARQWNRAVRAEKGIDHAWRVKRALAVLPLAEQSAWCDERRAPGMGDSTYEALLDVVGFRADRAPAYLRYSPAARAWCYRNCDYRRRTVTNNEGEP
jgi:hypothetical protein